MRFRYVIGPDGTVAVSDRGLAYGDGLFETMAIRHGAVQRFSLHIERLELGCRRLQMPSPDHNELLARIASLTPGIAHGSLKLILTRGEGPRGYTPPESPSPVLILSAATRSETPPPAITVVSLSQRLGENPALAGIKHLCRLEQVLGRQELQALGADEGLMHASGGQVIGGTSRNVFAVFRGTVITPELSRCGVAGVMRRSVLERCTELGIQSEEREILPAELDAAEELFMTNALVGIQSVSRLDDKTFPPGRMAGRLRDALDQVRHD